MSKREYRGDPLNMAYTPITERPELEDAEDVVYATDPEAGGEETTENVPIPVEDDDKDEPVRIPGQTTLSEWK